MHKTLSSFTFIVSTAGSDILSKSPTHFLESKIKDKAKEVDLPVELAISEKNCVID